jgi:hypothetical protein
LNRLRQQGLDSFSVNVVFNTVIMSEFLYACQAFSGFLCASDMSRLQTSLNKVYRYKLTAVKYDIKNLFEEHDSNLFKQILLHPDHCLHDIFCPQLENHGRLL